LKNINIFHISPFPYYTGGIDTWLYSFLTINEKEHTYNVTLYCTGEVQPEKEAAFDITHFKHVKIIYLSTYPGFGLMPLWSIQYLFSFMAKKSGENANLSLALGTVPVLLPLFIMKKFSLLKGDVYCSVRGQIAQDGIDLKKPKFLCWALKTLEGFLLKRVDKVFVNGEDTKAYLQRFYQLDSTVIANGFDDEKLNLVKVPENLPSALVENISNKKVLLHVGTLRPIKGIDYILNAYAALDDEAKNKSLLIFVGKGQEAFYKNVAKKLGINVYFLGEKSNPLDYITLADAVINVSGGSGVSNSLLEALAMGKPVIAWDNLTFSQVMDDKSGVLCKTHDVQSLACGFAKIINGDNFDQALVKASVKPYYWSSIWYKWKQYLT
tara:strand:- start:1240 stop:2382 length:1143 start_codon:yes stop_codon:yes gene_type:complete